MHQSEAGNHAVNASNITQPLMMGCMHRQFNITFVANLSKQQAHVNSTFHDNRLAVPLCKIIIIKCDLR